ncbi:MAG: sensor histidine kinase [Candidatus Lernaella stagnicola]|nr:sensor histidine kinase [Candidatus Lernaella stagnicola]
MATITDKTTSSLRFSPDILRRLGEELISSPYRGLVELVKNSHDADAMECVVKLDGVDKPGGTVRIVDDGIGLTKEDVLRGWLILGRSRKDSYEPTKMGRKIAGNKGLGRLAALRLGHTVLLTTRPAQECDLQHEVLIDWSKFSEVDVVEDVPLLIETSRRPKGLKQGTEIEISGLHSQLTENDVKKLARELVILANPFADDPKAFRPRLESPQFKEYEARVSERYFDQADYHLSASVDEKGQASAQVLDYRGQVLWSADHETLQHYSDYKEYTCPVALFDVWVFVLSGTSFSSRTVTLGEVRQWLKIFGGIHFYLNGLRVPPYGDPGDDWLDLNLRRSQSPEARPSTNTLIGRIVVGSSGTSLLQKTDRIGFQEDKDFQELRAFATSAMEWMAARRLEQDERRRQKTRSKTSSRAVRSKEELIGFVEKADVPPTFVTKLTKRISDYDSARNQEVKSLRGEVLLYRTLSTAGITSATFAHESSAGPTKTILLSLKSIKRRVREDLPDKYDERYAEPLDKALRATESMAVFSRATLSLIEHEKRRWCRVDVHDSISKILDSLKPFTDRRDLNIDRAFVSSGFFVHAAEAAIEAIIVNLINNSVAALETVHREQRIIRISTEKHDDNCAILFQDNGPGIQGITAHDIWLPGRSTKRNGTGLGLTIVRDTIIDLGGRIKVTAKCELGGAEFMIHLPTLGD